ncbi:MAG TPA: T9SS type A sorting domain-containing protein, partial [Bacteroidia bacterium]|nr:T9SS type A sorting domain-containing protein [Bacteroidia bacterium]
KPNGGFWVTGKGLYTSTNDNLFLASLDNAGQVVWHHNYDMYDDVQRVILLQDGNLAMCGYNIDLNLGIYNQSYLIKTDTTGTVIWGKQYGDGGTIDDKLWAIDETSDRGFIMAGSTYGTGIQRTSWIVRADSSGNSGCRDSSLTVTMSTLTIASTSGGTVSTASFATNTAIGQLNANMSIQYFCGGPNGVPETFISYVWCYPQPATNELTVQTDPLVYDAYSIFDAQGKLVRTSGIINYQTVIDLNGLAAGTYTLMVSGAGAATSMPVIVE